MLSATQRAVLFWSVCIPLRTYLATRGDVPWLRAAALVIGIRWVAGYEVGNEGVFGGPAWWAKERPLHGLLLLLYASTGQSKYLKADTALGAANWVSNTGLPIQWP